MRALRNYALLGMGTVGFLLLAGIAVLLAVSVQSGPEAPLRHTAVDGVESYPMRHAFGNPVVTLVQTLDDSNDWNWLYYPDRSACEGRQEIASQQADHSTPVSGGDIAIGSTGLVQLDLPAGAIVFASMAVTLGDTTWTIPYMPAAERQGRAAASLQGGIYAAVPEAGLPARRSATAQLQVSPVTAHECYALVAASWRAQAVVAVAPAFPDVDVPMNLQNPRDTTFYVNPHPDGVGGTDDHPLYIQLVGGPTPPPPTPAPDGQFRALAAIRASADESIGGTNPVTTPVNTWLGNPYDNLVAGAENEDQIVAAGYFHARDRVNIEHRTLTIPGCLDAGARYERYFYTAPLADGPTRIILGAAPFNLAGNWPRVATYYVGAQYQDADSDPATPETRDPANPGTAYGIWTSAYRQDCHQVGGLTLEVYP